MDQLVTKPEAKLEIRDSAPQVGSDTKPPAHIEDLIVKDWFAERGQGKALNQGEKAELSSWREFPKDDDIRYRDLARREILAQNGGAKLTPEEQADLSSKRQFPGTADTHYRDLARKESLSENGGEQLTREEQADLTSKRRFPSDTDMKYRDLDRRATLAKSGGEPLTPEEDADLRSKFAWRKGGNVQEAIRKGILAEEGRATMTAEEKQVLNDYKHMSEWLRQLSQPKYD
jgi:hypothetical protein